MGSIDQFFYSSYWSILATTIDASTLLPRFARSTSGTSELEALSARSHAAPGKDVGAQGVLFPWGSHRLCLSWQGHRHQDACGLPGPPRDSSAPKALTTGFMDLSTAGPGLEYPGTAAPRCWWVRNAILGIETLLLPSCGAVKACSSHWSCEGLSPKLCLVGHMTAEMHGAVLVLEVTGLPRVRQKYLWIFVSTDCNFSWNLMWTFPRNWFACARKTCSSIHPSWACSAAWTGSPSWAEKAGPKPCDMQCDLSKQMGLVLVSWVLDVFVEVFPKALADIGHLPTAAALQSTWQESQNMGSVQWIEL